MTVNKWQHCISRGDIRIHRYLTYFANCLANPSGTGSHSQPQPQPHFGHCAFAIAFSSIFASFFLFCFFSWYFFRFVSFHFCCMRQSTARRWRHWSPAPSFDCQPLISDIPTEYNLSHYTNSLFAYSISYIIKITPRGQIYWLWLRARFAGRRKYFY